VIERNRVGSRNLGCTLRQNARDGTKLRKWFNLKLATEIAEINWFAKENLKEHEARVGYAFGA
jgi:hypothetical protein